MNLLLVCKGEYRYWLPNLAAALTERGCTVSAVTFSTPSTRMLDETHQFAEVHSLAAHLKRWLAQFDEHSVRCLQELDLSGELGGVLNTMVYADRILRNYDFETATKMMAGIYDFWATLFTKTRFDAVVGEIASATEWLACLLARIRSIPYLVPYPAPLTNRFYFLRSPNGAWESAAKAYEQAKASGLSKKETQVAEDFLCAFRANKPKPMLPQLCSRSPLYVDPRRLMKRLGRVPFRFRTYLTDGYLELGSYDGTPPWSSAAIDARRLVKHMASKLGTFETKVPRGKQIYFPLHVQPEFTIDVRAPFSSNQLALVENFARSIPIGYQLLVKEHPAMRGYRALGFYRQMKRLYNVRLLSPSLDSHQLIQNAEVILTIVGTTAWEGILYEKPVIALGPLCYGFFDLIYPCDDIADFAQIVSEAIRGFKPNRSLVLKFIWALLASAHEGLWDSPLRSAQVTERSNIAKLAEAILSEISTTNTSDSVNALAISQ